MIRYHIKQRLKFFLFFFLVIASFSNTFTLHNTNKYFTFLERPEHYRAHKKPYVHCAFFHTTATTAFKTNGGNTGVFDLWGSYDLKDVALSLQTAQKLPHNPITNPNFKDQSILFSAAGKIKTVGLMLHYEHELNWHNIALGIWMPVLNVKPTSRYDLLNKSSFTNIPQAPTLIDDIRRDIHKQIGFTSNNWSTTGVGDIDVHVRWHNTWDHQCMMRCIQLALQAGVLIPTGIKSNINNPASVSVMGSGHWGLYLDVNPEFELRQNLKVGALLGAAYAFSHTKTKRIPVYKEPAIFSSLIGPVKTQPGITTKVSPYLIFEHLTDGLHFNARYTYLRHTKDSYCDMRTDKSIASYLTKKPTDQISQENIDTNIFEKKKLSKWIKHYITLGLTYDSKEALRNWKFNPIFYTTFDTPIGGRSIAKNHQITVGVELYF